MGDAVRKSLLIAFLTAILIGGLAFFGNAYFGTVQASTNVTGIISSNATWLKANSPYTLTGNVLVNNDVTLTIEAGATVNLNSYYIMVNGTLRARGSIADRIHINGLMGEIMFTQYSNGWNEQTGSGSIIENAVLTQISLDINATSPKINNNSINGHIDCH